MEDNNNKLWLNEAMKEFNKKLDRSVLNIINAHAGSGKSKFIFEEFLRDSKQYVNGLSYNYIDNLDRVLYVCDTTMLKSSILKETDGITKILEKNDLKQAMKDKTLEDIVNGDVGDIKVITYSTLGFLLKNKASRTILLKYYNCIIMDEIHNLIKYAYNFKNDNSYKTIIEWLPTMLYERNLLLVALTATPYNMYYPLQKTNIMYRTIFHTDELKKIKKKTDKWHGVFKHAINYIKILGINYNWMKDRDEKVLIYVNTISVAKKYKTILTNSGYKVEWLCSTNNTKDDKLIMNDKQLRLREYLLNTGQYPEELDVLIINGAYETGWNLYDKKVQWVLIDSTRYDTQIQARNRVRNDIDTLLTKEYIDEDGQIIEFDQYKNTHETGTFLGLPKLVHILKEDDKEYLGKKLTKEDKDYLVNKYSIVPHDKKKATWQTFLKELEKNDYIVKTNSHGTYIYEKDNENKINMEVKKMSMGEKFTQWIENEWDKKRISIQDVKDILDIGTTSFNKMVKSESIISYFKDNRYNIGTVKGGNVKYLKKY